jgi:hypothetical protein
MSREMWRVLETGEAPARRLRTFKEFWTCIAAQQLCVCSMAFAKFPCDVTTETGDVTARRLQTVNLGAPQCNGDSYSTKTLFVFFFSLAHVTRMFHYVSQHVPVCWKS